MGRQIAFSRSKRTLPGGFLSRYCRIGASNRGPRRDQQALLGTRRAWPCSSGSPRSTDTCIRLRRPYWEACRARGEPATMRTLAQKLKTQVESLRQSRFRRRLQRRGNVLEPHSVVPRGSEIGTRVRVGKGTEITGPIVILGGEPVSFGRYCAVGRGVRIYSSNHRTDILNVQDGLQVRLRWGLQADSRPVSIGHNVWIGDGAIILRGVQIGNGAVIGAGAVVTRDVDPFAVAVGCPAREIRKRFSDQVIAEIEELAWWDWSMDKLRANRDLFMADFTRLRVSDRYPAGRSDDSGRVR